MRADVIGAGCERERERRRLVAEWRAFLGATDWQLAFHGTFKNEPPCPLQAIGHVRKMVRRITRYGGGPVQHFAATEIGRFGRLHVHGLLAGVSACSPGQLKESWGWWDGSMWRRLGRVQFKQYSPMRDLIYVTKDVGRNDNELDFSFRVDRPSRVL